MEKESIYKNHAVVAFLDRFSPYMNILGYHYAAEFAGNCAAHFGEVSLDGNMAREFVDRVAMMPEDSFSAWIRNYAKLRIMKEFSALPTDKTGAYLGVDWVVTTSARNKGVHFVNELRVFKKGSAMKELKKWIESQFSQAEEKRDVKMPKRLLVDMDGTLAKFHNEVNYLERMYEKGFFLELNPFENMVAGIRLFIHEHPEVDVFVASAKIVGEPPYCELEKNEWLDRYLPEIDRSHRIFTDIGKSKAEYLEGGVTPNDYLLDDYNQGLNLFMASGGQGIKCHNNINQRGLGAYGGDKGYLWTGKMVHTQDSPELISAQLSVNMGLDYDREKICQFTGDSLDTLLFAEQCGFFETIRDKAVPPITLMTSDNTELRLTDAQIKAYCNNLYSTDEYAQLIKGDASSLLKNVEYWHTHDTGITLRDFLGMTSHEYEEWLKGSDPIFHELADDIQKAREQDGKPIYGQINHLNSYGNVGYTDRYYSAEEMQKVIDDYKNCGEPISVDWFIPPKEKTMDKLKTIFEIEDALYYGSYGVSADYAAFLAHAIITPYDKRSAEERQALTSFWEHNKETLHLSMPQFLRMPDEEYIAPPVGTKAGNQKEMEKQPGYAEWSEPSTKENAPDASGCPSDDVSAYLSTAETPQRSDHASAAWRSTNGCASANSLDLKIRDAERRKSNINTAPENQQLPSDPSLSAGKKSR